MEKRSVLLLWLFLIIPSVSFAGFFSGSSGGGSGPGGGANANGYYFVTRTDNAPTNAVNLGGLSTGFLYCTISSSICTPSIFALDTDLSSVSVSDDTIPSAKAVKSYADGKQASDSDLTSLANGITGIVKGAGNGGGYSAASAVTDYITPATLGTNAIYAAYSLGTCTTAATVDPVNGRRQSVILTNAQTCVLTFTQPAAGCTASKTPYDCCTGSGAGATCRAIVQVRVQQSAAGSFNGAISGGKWPGGVTPTITQTSGAVDYITCDFDGTNANCVPSQDFR